MGESGNLKEHLDRRKRINRIKSSIFVLIFVWMLASILALVFLIARVAKLEKEVSILAGNQVYSGQVDTNQNASNDDAE